jgi:hypothetical protein
VVSSYDYDDRRDRGTGRHRTRTPELDAYEADRRKAQADCERSYRKASFVSAPHLLVVEATAMCPGLTTFPGDGSAPQRGVGVKQFHLGWLRWIRTI